LRSSGQQVRSCAPVAHSTTEGEPLDDMRCNGLVVCPETGSPLQLMPLERAEHEVFGGRVLQRPTADGYLPVGPTPEVMVREDGEGAYPVRHGVPVLLSPEMLVPLGVQRSVDVSEPRFAEAYREMDYYSEEARREAGILARSKTAADIDRVLAAGPEAVQTFPDNRRLWIDAKFEAAAQLDALRHLMPIAGARVLQVGGRGIHAVKLLLAGAREAWVVSPMVGELVYAEALASYSGVRERLRTAAAVAEELPFRDDCFDAVYSQGCVHHWVTALALPECRRVLRPGGRFAAVEPWRAPLYGIGTRLLGKRQNVGCVVLTADRVKPHLAGFDDARIIHHWALTRYMMLALGKLGVGLSREAVWRIGRIDDALTAPFPKLRDSGSSVAILACRSEAPAVPRDAAA
jgi:uncharacterized protein YbaR (Trm112 family)